MQVTVEIPDELAEQAKSRGETPEQFVAGLLQSAMPEKKATSTLDEMFDRLGANSDKVPQLPDEAFTRESFYRDHD